MLQEFVAGVTLESKTELTTSNLGEFNYLFELSAWKIAAHPAAVFQAE